MGVIAWILFGLIAGLIAKAIHPGKDPGGWIAAIVIGILGGVIGGWVGMALGWGDVDGFNIRSFLLAVAGSVLLLFIWAKVSGRNRVDRSRHLDA
ncbi:MAG: GlsB/YeaQ/YmgE family stress response membrane protein [Sphingobacteriales bacterium]|nr:MAG: GlsB/YeaQ/YmgE family stress response membrane protein [Sphingobacteriales bacterium]